MMAADPVLSPSSTVMSEDDFFCPDCAQRQWSRASDDRARPGHASYWQWTLVAVGVFLIVGNALQFASAAGRLITSETVVSSVPRLGWQATPNSSDYHLMVWTSAPVADARTFDALTPPIILGLVAIIVGLGSRTRQRLTKLALGQAILSETPPSRRNRAPPWYVLAVWGAAESFALSFTRVLFVGFVLFVAAHAIRGEPPTLELLNQSLTRTIDLAVKLAVMLAPQG